MNYINFTGYSNFPLSSDTMAYLQQMVTDLGKLSLVGGNSYILTGCEEVNSNVSTGIVVLDGVPYPFGGGAKQANIYIKEEKRSVEAMGYSFADVYATRSVQFGIGNGQRKWADMKRLPTNLALQDQILAMMKQIEALQGLPSGIICMWSGSPDNIPTGWKLCNGDNGTPDLKGRFVVGYNVSDTEYNAVGKKNDANKTMTLTAGQMPKHRHGYHAHDWQENTGTVNGQPFPQRITEGVSGKLRSAGNSANAWVYGTTYEGKSEPVDRRPPYYVLAYIMKI